ncbi:MAG TPA: efflux RND transporter periplasmic adaptor subunit [Methylovirgula sp.]|nr:efflux RND transporter periplasmic adaptor subunit [Methylovirgula sp.]
MLQVSPPLTEAKSPSRRINVRIRWVAAAALLVLAGVGGLAWWSTHRAMAVQYVTLPAARGTITRSATATGTVNPVLTIIVGAYDSGVIQNLYCDYTTQVRAGEVCARIDPRPYQAAFDQYSGQLLRDQAVLDKDRIDLARYQQLAAQNSIARQQADDQAYVVKQDEGTVKLDQAYVEGAKHNLDYTDIISPVDGIVVSRNVTGGQTVASSFQTPTLFLIATDLKAMEVDTNTSEGDMGGVKEGDKATFTVDAYPQRIFQGTVTQVRESPQTVQNVVTYDVVVGVDNSDLALMPGMTASTQIIIAQRNDVLRVPNQALRYVPGGPSAVEAHGARTPTSRQPQVWVLRNGQPVAVTVVPGLNDDNFTEIVKGDLHPGDQVITAEGGSQVSGQPGPPHP